MIRWMLVTAVAITAADAVEDNDRLTQTARLGPVEVETELAPKNPTIGDEITLLIRVKAEADVEVLMPEFGEALSRYTILDYVPKQQIDPAGRTVFTQRYTLQPYLSGKQSIPPILVEFVDNRQGHKPAPKDVDAYEILTERIDFEVESVLSTEAASELNPPLGELSLASNHGGSTWIWLTLGSITLVAAIVGGLFAFRQRRRRARRRHAYEIARSRLDRLLAGPQPQDEAAIEAFFVKISSIVRRYLEDRFDLRAPELTTEEFLLEAGSASGLSHDHQNLLRRFLRQADLVKFAGVRATEEDIRGSTDLAMRFLEETRENAPIIFDEEVQDDGELTPDRPGRADSVPGESGRHPSTKEDAHV